MVTTFVTLVVACVYSDIAGRADHWYNTPESWQFCVVYADATVQLWKQAMRDSVATQLSYMALMNLFYTW